MRTPVKSWCKCFRKSTSIDGSQVPNLATGQSKKGIKLFGVFGILFYAQETLGQIEAPTLHLAHGMSRWKARFLSRLFSACDSNVLYSSASHQSHQMCAPHPRTSRSSPPSRHPRTSRSSPSSRLRGAQGHLVLDGTPRLEADPVEISVWANGCLKRKTKIGTKSTKSTKSEHWLKMRTMRTARGSRKFHGPVWASRGCGVPPPAPPERLSELASVAKRCGHLPCVCEGDLAAWLRQKCGPKASKILNMCLVRVLLGSEYKLLVPKHASHPFLMPVSSGDVLVMTCIPTSVRWASCISRLFGPAAAQVSGKVDHADNQQKWKLCWFQECGTEQTKKTQLLFIPIFLSAVAAMESYSLETLCRAATYAAFGSTCRDRRDMTR